jgi:hypothetical protein
LWIVYRDLTPFIARHHMSLGADYALRLIGLFTDIFDGDVVLAVVFIAAAQAGTQHLRHAPNSAAKLSGGLFPDEARRPISISALARSLSLPVETTRRHVIKLVEKGFAVRSDQGGVLVTSAILGREAVQQAIQSNAINIKQLIDGLMRTPMER